MLTFLAFIALGGAGGGYCAAYALGGSWEACVAASCAGGFLGVLAAVLRVGPR